MTISFIKYQKVVGNDQKENKMLLKCRIPMASRGVVKKSEN